MMTFIVMGDTVSVDVPAKVSFREARRLALNGHTGRPEGEFEIRDSTGEIVNPERVIVPGTFYLSVVCGVGASHTNHRRRGYRPPVGRHMHFLVDGYERDRRGHRTRRDFPDILPDRWRFNQTNRFAMCANTFRQAKRRRNQGVRSRMRDAVESAVRLVIPPENFDIRLQDRELRGRYW